MKIQCRVDVDRFSRLSDRRKVFRQCLPDEIDEVGRLGVESTRHWRKGLRYGAFGCIV